MAIDSTALGIPSTPEAAVQQFGPLLLDIGVFIGAFLAVYLIGKNLLIRLIGRWTKKKGLDETIYDVAEKVANIVLFLAALSIALTVAGFPSFLTAFATLGGALALAIGFASQDLIGNFVAGLFILKDKPFRKGDWIEWTEGSGTVEGIDLRVTRVKTFDNELITVPNGELANNAVKNPVAFEKLRQKFVFGISYEDDVGDATEIILEEAENHEGIMEDPGPSVRLTELGDSSVGLQARIWIDNPSRADFVKVKSEFVRNVKERFDEEDIEFPYPIRDLTGSVKVEDV